MKSIVRSISFDADTLDWIDARAQDKHANRSQVVREAILFLMAAVSEAEERQEQEGREGAFGGTSGRGRQTKGR